MSAKTHDQQFAELYLTHRKLVYAVCKAMVPEPEDVCQEVWRGAYGSFRRFDSDKGSFTHWIATRARWESIQTIRARRRRPFLVFPEIMPEISSFEPISETRIERLKLKVLRHLPAKYRRVMDLLAEGMAQEDIATNVGLSYASVRKQICQARKILRTVRNSFTAI